MTPTGHKVWCVLHNIYNVVKTKGVSYITKITVGQKSTSLYFNSLKREEVKVELNSKEGKHILHNDGFSHFSNRLLSKKKNSWQGATNNLGSWIQAPFYLSGSATAVWRKRLSSLLRLLAATRRLTGRLMFSSFKQKKKKKTWKTLNFQRREPPSARDVARFRAATGCTSARRCLWKHRMKEPVVWTQSNKALPILVSLFSLEVT